MDYTKLFKEDYNHNAQNPRYSNDASDDEYLDWKLNFKLEKELL